MNLIVLTESEFKDIQHFAETGKRLEGVRATDAWVEKALLRCIQEIKELEDRMDVWFETAKEASDTKRAARKIYNAWRKGELTNDLMNELGVALRRRKS